MTAIGQDMDESRLISRQLGELLLARLGPEGIPLRHVRAGVTLLRAGDRFTRLPYVASGRLDAVMRMGDDGAHLIPVSFGPGEVGFLSRLFCHKPSFADLIAGQALTVRWLDIADLERLVQADRELMGLLVRFLAHRIWEVRARERTWLERGVHERVCIVLLRLARAVPADASGRCTVHATHEELSARSGVSRPKVSQELKKLEQKGWLRLERGRIRILDLDSLSHDAM